MSSIVLSCVGFKSYEATVGPRRGRPPRPKRCPFCDGTRIWFDGWRVVYCTVLVDGTPHRFDDGLPIQRAECATCSTSWPLRPAFLYPHRSYAPDIAEGAAIEYLAQPEATCASVAERYDCAPSSVWRWTGWAGDLAAPAEVIAEAARIDPATPAAMLVPREVPGGHGKARSADRAARLLRALQTLVAVGAWARALPHPPDDPSALRAWLTARFLAFRGIALLRRAGFSPPVQRRVHGPSG